MKPWIWLFLILLMAGFFRFFQLDFIPPGLFPDEAMNGNNAYEALGTRNFKVFYRENFGREGLFINIQAISIAIFGNTAFALRIVSAVFGTLTVLAVYFFVREYTKQERIALLASFFVATSFWHILFSRIGFRAITAPFFLTLGLGMLYALWNRVHSTNHAKLFLLAGFGGFIFGLGFHSYIAYRVAPLLLITGFLLFVKEAKLARARCVLCLPAVYLLFLIIAAFPLLLYFAFNPQDFFGRTSQISILASENPLRSLALNTGKTLGMFLFAGDFNWRHNFSGAPALWWPVVIFFLIGIVESIRKKYFLLPLWFIIMMLPVVVSSEGVPHALRSIILIPPTFIFAALGLDYLWWQVTNWLEKKEKIYKDATKTIRRIKQETNVLVIIILVAVGIFSYNLYFGKWAKREETRAAFESELYEYGLLLNRTPPEIPKFVVTDADRIDLTGVPMALQPIIFATGTYHPEPPGAKNIFYITLSELPNIDCAKSCMLIPIGNQDQILGQGRELTPDLKIQLRDSLLVGIKETK